MLQIVQNLVYLVVSVLVMIKLKSVLLWSNYLSIIIFNVSFLGRSLMYSFLYWDITARGQKEVEVPSQYEIVGDVQKLYRIRFFNNLFDFMTVTVFYYLILKMQNLWDRIIYDKLSSSQSENDRLGTPKFENNMERQLSVMRVKLQFRRNLRIAFVLVFATTNLAMFVIQVLYLTVEEEKEDKVRFAITILTICLFFVDAAMIITFLVTTFKFSFLLHPYGHQRTTRLFCKAILVIIAAWMFLRSINANIFRTGSLLLDFIYGDKLDIALWQEEPEGSYQLMIQVLTVIQSVFTLVIGLCILAVYSIFGLSKLNDAQTESLHDSSLLNSSQFSGLKITP